MVLFVSSEIYPFAKTGGLADVAYALPKALEDLIEIYSVMPLYSQIDREKFGIEYSGKSFDVILQNKAHTIDIFIQKDDAKKIFLYNPILCDRIGLYYDSYGEFGDNDLRFGIFNYGVLQTIGVMDLNIKTLHINDWQCALLALLVKQKFQLPYKVVLTIHNLAYQGVFDKDAMDRLELSWHECFKPEILEYYDRVNFLKAGIFYSDTVTTVSPNYAKEIQTPYFGHSLDSMLQIHSQKLEGILNGIDCEVFDPKNDLSLEKNYDSNSIEKKQKNKKILYKEFGLSNPKRALFVFIGRFVGQKGVDLMVENMDRLSKLEANFIFLGSGEPKYDNYFQSISMKYENIRCVVGYDEALSKKLYASGDFLLMPSFFEPCGLNQMIAMRYGAVPIVSNVGGLHDTVKDFKEKEKLQSSQGQGIVLHWLNSMEFFVAVSRAISLYSDTKSYESIVKKNMQIDFSWKKSAKKYLKAYR